MTSMQTSVAMLGMAAGARQSWAPNVRVVEPTVSDRLEQRKGSLYVLVELIGVHPSPQVLYRQVVNVVQRVYYEAPGSPMAALQSAIMEVHLLMQDAGATGGVSCVVLRDRDIFIAQVSPALVIIAQPKVVRLFPVSPEASKNPLGGKVRPDIGLFSATLEIPAAILLAESRWLNRAEAKILAGATTAPSLSEIVDVLAQLAGRDKLSAMAVGLGLPAQPPEAPEPVGMGAWGDETYGAGDAYEAQAAGAWAGSSPGQDVDARRTRDTLREGGRGLATAGSRLAERAKTLGERMLPEPETAEPKHQRVRERKEKRPARWPVIVAIAMPVLVAAVAGSLWFRQVRERDRQFSSLLEGARAALDATTSMEDEALIRVELDSAEERVEQALVLKPADPDAENIQREIRRALDHVNRVVALPMMMPLQELAGTGRDLGRVLLSGRNIFVLDRGRDEVYWYQLDPELPDAAPPVGDGPVIRKGQQVGPALVSELGDIAWLTASGLQDKSGLLVLDQSGGLFLNDVTGMWEPARLDLELPADWRYPQAADSYQGNFYVLEPSLHQIFRYTPSGEGYAGSPTHYFEEGSIVNLGGVVDMAISSEACGGHVYLLYRNGILTKYTRGVAEPFEAIVPDARMQDTPAFFVGPEMCHLYIADAGNGRLVELDANGTFLFQYRLAEGDALRSVRSLFVDEVGDAFYILTADTLYRTPIPR
ncbi:MAG TPA: hypothetical protein VM537_10885 [Anaerolineae bacterium]|nr:hypothetical protein [Anaerolineae bacterium]